MLKEKCYINTNKDKDTFVGIQCLDGDIKINFPLGFSLDSTSDSTLRKDILLLLNVLRNFTQQQFNSVPKSNFVTKNSTFPLFAYLYILKDYVMRGYYKENIVEYHKSKTGKINWSRTIKTQRPYIQDLNVFYLDFITKKTVVNENELITLIHQYCVYKSFQMLGWLYTNYLPVKPQLKFNQKLFINILKRKLATTFNDADKLLFKNLIVIVNNENDYSFDNLSFSFGTNRFEYVWEKMIDRVYGETNKTDYFPKTHWHIYDSENLITASENAPLEPDTIMINDNNIFVLDAKYYKYGVTRRSFDLPGTSSISKQITYGEYIFKNKTSNSKTKVYNAFIMPFNSSVQSENRIQYIGTATSEWKNNDFDYEKVLGILVDVKYLMQITNSKNYDAINELSNLIEEKISKI